MRDENVKESEFKISNEDPIEENSAESAGNKNNKNFIIDTPLIPESIYQQLPRILMDSSYKIEVGRGRDVYLTGALAILSGIFSNVFGIYNHSRVYLALNCFVVAPPASGKGNLQLARALGNHLQNRLEKQRKEALEIYWKLLSEQKKKGKKDNGTGFVPEPEMKALFFPGNSSSAIIIKLLKDNEVGIICETEADTLSGANRNEWGQFTDIIRKSSHHETISYSRKGNYEYVIINEPKLVVALAGTPNQVSKLIPSTEDGSFSRFLFYTFNDDPIWRNIEPKSDTVNLSDYFDQVSADILKIHDYTKDFPFEFRLSANQWNIFNSFFNEWTISTSALIGREIVPSIFRLGLMLFRVAGVLTTLRRYEAQEKSLVCCCNDLDFQTAVSLIDLYREHMLAVYEMLPRQGRSRDRPVMELINRLPKSFTRAEAVEIGSILQLRTRTIDKYLSLLEQKELIEKVRQGYYKKLE